ncbi:UDP-N-acetylglucosamine-N-acetylmuramylpentapeptide N-acetylglucosamine transferase [Alkalispirochaeta americana]|uniref:UDP-N-acetylglucosamine--N-acetylmuramyl-(pentapeptide) pyrophosphoryl-undecaprenol N-acetylglucosamine transferase n=1 Tax=Alkalispirochaeta americana TaxID=159291 RepID=A0A1N6UXJ1_9SPIO|nr:undecaprenyldiphospho-muramoylpentapeptide beta-N-acetylglucosaminyltransferase [Alkalispirochaeta americana]SIQ70308.1 UDP-N-acetylglucosamine-N-acetylmuramylpentapeptide N-acetylglucosamine transferase [Alkalispirochaeta americana]
MSTIVFTGGGTGGHVYPGLAVYRELSRDHQEKVLWIGSRRGIERGIVGGEGLRYRSVPTGKLRRYFDWQNFLDLFRVAAGFFAALWILKREGASLVFSKGGFVAVPVVAAARVAGIPVVVHESDADPGLATRLTAPLARVICLPYEESIQAFSPSLRGRVVVTGNPVRREFFSDSSRHALSLVGLQDEGLPVILVTGGSLGAHQLNRYVREQIKALTEIALVVHQTGDHGKELIGEIAAEAVPGRYAGFPSFSEEFAPLLQRSDLVICRAGAGSIWELAVTATPAVLVPLSSASSRGDQVRNAARYAASGAALVFEGGPEDSKDLLVMVQSLLEDSPRRAAMAEAARSFAGGNSARSIAGIIGRIIE